MTGHSIITLYESSGILPEKSIVIDKMAEYLETLQKTIKSDCIYQKISSTMEIKLDLGQEYLTAKPKLDYISIVNVEPNGDESIPFYFFVISAFWISRSAVRLELKMDTIATFFDDVFSSLDDKTLVKRSHRDRFIETPYFSDARNVIRNIDKYAEGLPVSLFKKDQRKITIAESSFDVDWFLIYETREDLSPDNIANPVDCFVMPSATIPIQTGTGTGELTPEMLEAGKVYYISVLDNPHAEMTISGSTYRLGESARIIDVGDSKLTLFRFKKNAQNAIDVDVLALANINEYRLTSDVLAYPADSTHSYNVASCNIVNATILRVDPNPQTAFGKIADKNIYELKSLTPLDFGWGAVLQSFNTISRNESRLMKIVKLPYAPFSVGIINGRMTIPSGYIFVNGRLKVEDIEKTEFFNRGFSRTLEFLTEYQTQIKADSSASPRIEHERYLLDSKLFHSDFYTKKFVYDSFSFSMQLEMLKNNLPTIPTFDLNFKPSANISSKFLFEARLIGDDWARIDIGDFDWLMIVSRNNEMPIFTNGYVDYIRNGYNYDVKTKNESQFASLVSGVAGITTGIAGAIATGGVGVALFASTAQTAINGILSAKRQDQAIEQKLATLKSQSSNVRGSDELDLMTHYTGNRLWEMNYSASQAMEKALDDLFFFCGYACNTYERPNIDSRHWFNYIECDPSWEFHDLGIWQDYRDDISSRLQNGLTILHYRNGIVDLGQERENYESWLIAPSN